MNKRQWAIVQIALLILRNAPSSAIGWDDEHDGPPPTGEEIDQLVQQLGTDPGVG